MLRWHTATTALQNVVRVSEFLVYVSERRFHFRMPFTFRSAVAAVCRHKMTYIWNTLLNTFEKRQTSDSYLWRLVVQLIHHTLASNYAASALTGAAESATTYPVVQAHSDQTNLPTATVQVGYHYLRRFLAPANSHGRLTRDIAYFERVSVLCGRCSICRTVKDLRRVLTPTQ